MHSGMGESLALQFWTRRLQDWRWPIVAAIGSFMILLTAHAFERFGNMPPCPLCLRQREIYWALISMVAVGLFLWMVRPNPRFLVALNVLVGLVFLTGAVVAGFHAGVEYGWWPAPAGCAAGTLDASAMATATSGGLLGELEKPQFAPACTYAPWSFGLSMAGWNAVMSLGLAVLSFFAAQWTADAQRSGA